MTAVAAVNGDTSVWKMMEKSHCNHSTVDADTAKPGDGNESSTKKSIIMQSIEESACTECPAPYDSIEENHIQSPNACVNSAFDPDDNISEASNQSIELPSIDQQHEIGLSLAHSRPPPRRYSSHDIGICTTNVDAVCSDRESEQRQQSTAPSSTMHFDNPIFAVESADRTDSLTDDVRSTVRFTVHPKTTTERYGHTDGLRSRSSSAIRQRSTHDDPTQPKILKRTQSNNS